MMICRYGAVSDKGDRRKDNQDSWAGFTGVTKEGPAALFVVADGMGGLSYGSQASGYITEQFASWWKEDLPQMIQAGRTSAEDIDELLEQGIWEANQGILQFSEKLGERSGSTLSILFLFKGRYHVKNIGDSRVYLIRDGYLKQISQDQSLVAQWVREGRMTEAEARCSKQRNKLTMCVGMYEVPRAFTAGGVLRKGDSFLLCSDGFYNSLEPEDWGQVLGISEFSPQKKAEILRQLIVPGEASDNVTVVLAETHG